MQKAPLSPLQLRHSCFTNISVQTNPNGLPDGQITLEPFIAFQKNQTDANQWLLSLRVIMKSTDAQKPFIYDADIGIHGLVEVQADFPAEKREQIATVNGLSILYSSIREMLLMMTARSGHGPMCLPTLSFVEVLANKIAEDGANAKAPISPQVSVTSSQK
jgi:preprotein translocase subunit SecB